MISNMTAIHFPGQMFERKKILSSIDRHRLFFMISAHLVAG